MSGDGRGHGYSCALWSSERCSEWSESGVSPEAGVSWCGRALRGSVVLRDLLLVLLGHALSGLVVLCLRLLSVFDHGRAAVHHVPEVSHGARVVL